MRKAPKSLPVLPHFLVGCLGSLLAYFLCRAWPGRFDYVWPLSVLYLIVLALDWLKQKFPVTARLRQRFLVLNSFPLNRRSETFWGSRLKKLSDEGIWRDAPIAEVDKSTIGKLLASRMSREPGLHVVVTGRNAVAEPLRLDALYDHELDG